MRALRAFGFGNSGLTASVFTVGAMRPSMRFAIALKAFVVWMGILALAVVNGVLRESVLIPGLRSTSGLISSGLFLSMLIVAAAYLALPWIGARQAREISSIGIGWFLLTLAFEISFGLIRRHPDRRGSDSRRSRRIGRARRIITQWAGHCPRSHRYRDSPCVGVDIDILRPRPHPTDCTQRAIEMACSPGGYSKRHANE